MHAQDLTIHRGARFDAVAWVAFDEDGRPRRDTAGLTVVAKVRRYRQAPDLLHAFACSTALVAFPGLYDDLPVAVAQLDAMTPAQTAALGFDRGVYDVVVNDAPVAGGLVAAPWVVSR